MFQILKRPGRCRRRIARRGEEYDGSRWTLHKSYDDKKDAEKALAHLEKKYNEEGFWKMYQFKLIEK
jgi:hypothetical protein